jgi:hypothetical protein
MSAQLPRPDRCLLPRERPGRAVRPGRAAEGHAETLERRVLSAFADSASLFRKTSCAVPYAHSLPDYNGHYGIRELCEISPLSQLDLCCNAHRVPTAAQIREVTRALPEAADLVVAGITGRAAVVSGLAAEQPRYYLQHALNS